MVGALLDEAVGGVVAEGVRRGILQGVEGVGSQGLAVATNGPSAGRSPA